MGILPASVCVSHVCSVLQSQKRASELLGLELQATVSHRVGAPTPLVLWKCSYSGSEPLSHRSRPYTLLFETRYLTEPGSHWLMGSRDLPISNPQHWSCKYMSSFYMGFENPNLSPHACRLALYCLSHLFSPKVVKIL